MVKILGIDLGNSNLTSFNGEDKFTCPSTYEEGVDKLEDGYQVLYKGKKILIGDTTLSYDFHTDKERECKRTMMYMLLHQQCKHNDHVVIVTNCPIDDYLNREKRKSFKDFLSKEAEIQITVGLSTKTVFIDEVYVVAEGMGIIYRYPELFENKLVGVIDIGGGEVNHSIFDDFNIVRRQSFSEISGMRFFNRNIRDILSKRNVKLTDLEIKHLINDPKEHSHLIREQQDVYLSKIESDIKSHNWSNRVKYFFTGGGSLTLKDKILHKFPNSTISTDPLYDNCVGNYLIGVLMWENRQEKLKC